MHDVVFLHPPAFPDFRLRPRDFGPISDVIPSYPIFDTYPLGFASLLAYLEERGFRARIINIAARMILRRGYSILETIRKTKAKVYAIDLHWLCHLNGALYLAKLVKEFYGAPVILGGISSTVFWRDLIKIPFIDFIMRGDTTEEPMYKLLEAIEDDKTDFGSIPNLVWKKDDRIVENEFNYVPETLEAIDYSIFVRCAARDGWLDYLPFANYIKAPIVGIFTVKGCTMNCAACGGSAYTYRKYFNRKKLALKRPEVIVEEMLSAGERIKASIFFIGDLQQTGKAKEILLKIREAGLDNSLIFEFFKTPSRELLEYYRKAGDEVYLQISPETHDEKIRLLYGRPYTNDQLLKFLKNAVRMNFNRIDLYFMVGLPKQDFNSAEATGKFAGKLCSKKIDTFIAPLAPFIDPGSLAYEFPARYGYRILFRSLKEYSKALNEIVWYRMMNYESEYMDRKTIALATYRASKILLRSKIEKGIVSEDIGQELIRKIELREESLLNEKTNPGICRILCDLGELYPSKQFFLSLRKKVIEDALLGFAYKIIKRI